MVASGPKKKVTSRAVYKTSSTVPDMTGATSEDEAIIMKLNVYSKDVNQSTEPPNAYNEFDPQATLEASKHGSFGQDDTIKHYEGCGAGSGSSYIDSNLSSMMNDTHMNTDCCNDGRIDNHNSQTYSPPVANLPEQPSSNVPNMRLVQLLADFEQKSRNSEWPSMTSISCYWCCHTFSCTPVGLPLRRSGDLFHVMGCFCSLECAAAYNFGMPRVSVDRALERFMLINALAGKIGVGGGAITPAPDRLALAMFGGPLDIEEFRCYHSSKRHVIINQPPMLTLVQQVEEVDERDMKSAYSYIPLDVARVEKFQEKVRLRRTRPLVDPKNTLDHCMKLRYGNDATQNSK